MNTLVSLQLKPTQDPIGALAAIGHALGLPVDAIRPLAPGSKDAQMSRYYVLDAGDAATAQELAQRLRHHALVAAAYVKPADTLPRI